MPPRDVRAFLCDICTASDGIARRIQDLTFEQYLADETLRLAVERLLGIVGEAVAQLQKVSPGILGSQDEVRQIIAFRNILVHGYYTVSHDIVWTIVSVKVPLLQRHAAERLGQLGN